MTYTPQPYPSTWPMPVQQMRESLGFADPEIAAP